MFTDHQVLFAALCLSVLTGAQAGDIYRWVDEQGRTHLSDMVPEKYKGVATRTDSEKYVLTLEQQREAAAQDAEAAQERAKRPTLPEARSVDVLTPTTPKAPTSPTVIKRPAQAITESMDCATRWRLFRESKACFGPFNTVGGGVKAEAFEHCNEIQSPALKCGTESNRAGTRISD
jgi:hypothetical protein